MAIKRILLGGQSIAVDTETGELIAKSTPPSTMAGGTKVVAAPATPEALVGQSTPCRSVWIGARCDSLGSPLNNYPVFIGDANGQNIPVTVSNFEGITIAIDDAAKVFIRVGAGGDGVAYRVLA